MRSKTMSSILLPPQHSLWVSSVRALGRSWAAMLCLTVLAVIIIAALLPVEWLPFDPTKGLGNPRFATPFGTDGYQAGHVLGTDALGRDVFSIVIAGSRNTLMIVFGAAMIGFVIGVTAGLVAGYKQGFVSALIMRLADIQLAFPVLVLLIAIVAAFGPSIPNLILILGFSAWAPYARLVYGEVRAITGLSYFDAAVGLKFSAVRILGRHVLPNVMPTVLVFMTFEISQLVLAESALSYLGLGVQPPNPSWGALVADGKDYLATYPWLSLVPGLVIVAAVLALNVLGDSLRDALEPE